MENGGRGVKGSGQHYTALLCGVQLSATFHMTTVLRNLWLYHKHE